MYRQDTIRQYSTLFCSILSLSIFMLLMNFPAFSSDKFNRFAIICPPPVSVVVPNNACEVYVNIPGPISNDPNCPLTMVTNDLTGMSDPSGIYPVSVFIITWEVEDDCGATMTCIQAIQVSDVTAPELVCPNGFSTDCVISQEPPYANLSEFLAQSGSMASDNCSLDTLSFGLQSDILISGTPCNGTVRRTYMIADPSGNVATCNQLITVMDTEPPMIACPADITVMGNNSDCSADITVSMPVVSDNCIIDNFVNDRNNMNDASGNYPVGTTVVVWTVTDVCGLSATCEMSITVQDGSSPTITCPDGVSISCDISNLPPYPDLTAFIDAGGSASDDCGITQFGLINEVSDGNNCPELVTRVYFVMDANGNQASCNQVISVNDTTPPSFTPPADISLFCSADITDLGITGQISNLNDNCDVTGLLVDYTDSFLPGVCPTQTRIERNWIAIDFCGNSYSEMQVISLTSENGPTALCRDITVYLDEFGEATTIPDSIDNGSFSDCDGALTLELDIDMFFCSDAASSPIEVRLIVIDACDNRDTCFSNVTVSDTLPPVLICPPNDSLECKADVSPPFSSLDMLITAGGEANDNCMIMTGSFTVGTADTVSMSCPLVINRTYEISDLFGNAAGCTQTIYVLDTTPPIIVTCPQDITMNLDPGICSTMVTVDMPQVSDNCGVEQIINDYTNTSDASGIYFAGTTEVLWTVSDSCGNEATCITTVSLSGQSPISCPNDTIVLCDISMYPPAYNFSEFLDLGGSINPDCGLDTSTFMWGGDTNIQDQPCNKIYSRVYIIQGNLGTEHQCEQIIIVSDTIPPIIQPVNPIISNNEFGLCGRNLTIITPTVDDNCGGMVNLVNSFNGTIDASGFYPVGTTTVTWFAEDECGNIDSISFTVTINDSQAPLLTCPPGVILSCNIDELPPYSTLLDFLAAGGTASDNCQLDTTSFELFNQVIIPMMGFSTGNRQYRIFDIYGNSAICNQNILIIDLVPPTIICPDNVVVQNDPNMCSAAVTINLPTVDDNCGVMGFENDYTNMQNASGEYPVGTTIVTYTVFDFRGNTATCSFEVVVQDNEHPNIICPPDVEGMCSIDEYPSTMDYNIFVDMGGSANDNCSIRENSLTFDQVSDNENCPETFTRTYYITDIHGNTGSCVQTIEIHDKTEPLIDCPASPIVVNNDMGECSAFVKIDLPEFSDNCGVVSITNDYNNTNNASGTYKVETTTVVFTATDMCSNTATCSIAVTVIDNELPTVICPPALSAQCNSDQQPAFTMLSAFIMEGGVVSDNCGVDENYIQYTDVSNGNTCPEIITRTYYIRDIFGNEATCDQTLTINDNILPEITCPANATEFNDVGQCSRFFDPGSPEVSDNCGIEFLTNDYNNSDSALDNYPVGITIIIWTVIDSCGNSATCSMSVEIEDNEPPTTTTADTLSTQCDVADVAIWVTVTDFENDGGTATDNCGLRDTIEYIGIVETGQDTFVRTYRVYDIYGNFTVISQVIVVRDDMPPSFNTPMDLTINCNVDINDLNITGNVTDVMDNCDNNPSITYSDQITPDCTNGDMVTRTWTVTDRSGNQTTMTQTIILVDNEAPIFDMTPATISPIACDDPFPTPQVLTATDNCKMVTITVDTLPYTVNNCTGYTVTYRWTASDECGNSNTTSASFQVLPDTQPPVIAPIPNLTVSTNPNSCEAIVNLSNPTVTDNCSTYTLSRVPSGNTFPLGETVITWTATDECSNSSTATQTIVVRDTQSPNLNCRDIQISLSGDIENVPAELIVVSATDNCTNIADLTIQARRMQEGCGIDTSDEFDSTFVVCCEDAGTQVTVIVRVIDEAGNFNECMRLVEVKDVQQPSLIQLLPDISVSCEFNFSTSNLSIFGTYRTEESQRQDIIINDHFYTGTGGLAGRDGLVGDNCPDQLTITESFQDHRVYNQGQIIRTFTVTDASGNSIQLQQIINVIEVDPFDESDITWPPHTDYQGCTSSAPPVSETGEPTWTNKKCAIVGSTYKDWVYTVPGSACKLVERKWKVVELAQNLSWEYKQYLTQVNTIAPIISSSCDDITVCANDATCQGNLNISASATDDCTPENQLNWQYQLDIDNDGSVNVNGSGKTLTSTVPQGTHRVTWIVNDGCGNSSSCSYLITVRDCKAPEARCLHGLSTDLGVMQMAMVWASDFNHYSTDNCTPSNQLRFTFSADPDDHTLNFTCDDLGLNPVDVWVKDLAGNFSVCKTYILITDTGNHCGLGLEDDGYSINLSGKIYTPEQTKICDAEVYLVGAETSEKRLTDENGVFSFEKLPIFNTYIIQPERDTAWLEGVSTLDLVLIQRHILGIETLTNPYQYIASDVNNSKSITVADLIDLRKLILGVYKKFPANKSWRFVDVKSEMSNPTNPWPFDEQVVLDNVVTHTVDADFIAIKIGDVSGSVSELRQPNLVQLRKAQSIDLLIGNMDFVQSDELEVLIYPQENISLCAFQFSVFINSNYLKLVDISSDYLPQLGPEHTAITEENGDQILNIAYHYPFDLAIRKDQELIKLKFKALKDGSLNHTLSFGSTHTDAKIYQLDGSFAVPRFRFKTKSNQQALNVSDGNPNPFREQTQFEIVLDKNQILEISVFDSNGKNLLRKKVSGKKGTNLYTLRAEDISNATGMIFVNIKIQDGEKEIKKMLRID